MIATTYSNNDIWTFFEKDELERIKTNIITGWYVNKTGSVGIATARIGAEHDKPRVYGERIWAIHQQGADESFIGLELLLLKNDCLSHLYEKGAIGEHQGFRHINVIDVHKIPQLRDYFSVQNTYDYLRGKVDTYLESCKSPR